MLGYRDLLNILILSAGLTFLNAAYAAENGTPTTAAGLYDFGTGFLPPATPYGTFAVRSSFYTANKNISASGSKINDPFSLDVLAYSLAWFKTTDYQILGAKYGFGLVQPFFDMNMHLNVVTPVGNLGLHDSVFRQADLQLFPVVLSWNLAPNFAVNAQLQIQAPTGDYDKNRLVSPGLNHWVFSPILNATYITAHGFELSSSFQTDFSTRNDDTNYKNGVEYRYEFALGQHIQNWTIGLGGYYYDQFTEDQNAYVEAGKSKVLAYGPAVSYFDGKGPSFWLHAYKEQNASMRSEGYNIALRVAQSF
ncbi:SphA family protein [Acinetobacter baylyi]|uniref:SphA family protein n=1 Tax=Acinetobacter baylyi TaxID=202950 RepID=UPI000EA34CA8|nr:transporter [Acinetobacter baylyi]